MSDLPTTPDREQQKADNNASRRQSGLDPLPKDRERADEGRAHPREPEEEPGEDEADPDR